MDLNEISVFIQVVQSGSFSGAAKKLTMPISTVSSKVSSLERRLGTTLIQRTTRKLSITPAGQSYFKRCIQGLEQIQTAEHEIAATQGEPTGLLRLTAPIEIGGNGILPEIISAYTQKYPKMRVEVIFSDRVMDLLSESVDLAIRAGELEDSSLIVRKIGSDHFGLYTTPRYLRARGTPTHPRELRSHSCIQFTPFGVDEWQLRGPKGGLNVPIAGRVVINDLGTVKRLTLEGDGIALLPTHSVQAEAQSGKLVRILPEWRTETSPMQFVYPGSRFVMPKVSAFIEMAMGPLRKTFAAPAEN